MAPLSRSRRTLGLFAFFLLTPAVALACLWDSDTLKQEQSRFPGTLELITGKFLRHSTEFYQWRIEDRTAKLKADPKNLAYLDDLAVAHEKGGDHAKAIETILKKEDIQPGVYETYSNLGTFHILAGEFEKGLPYIDKALAINPDAHFGREKYQKWLVEYAMGKRKDGRLLFPMQEVSKERHGRASFGFRTFLEERLTGGLRWENPDHSRVLESVSLVAGVPGGFLEARLERDDLSGIEQQKAVKGVLGMMRFADHENPLLLEALGDLLVSPRGRDGKQLATRAYLKASYAVSDAAAKQAYRTLAERALEPKLHPRTRTPMTLSDVEENFQNELAEARLWYDGLHRMESEWIRAGLDVEAEFDKLYAEEPRIEGRTDGAPLPTMIHFLIRVGCIVSFLVAIRGWRGRPFPLWVNGILFVVGLVAMLFFFVILAFVR